MRTLLTTLVSFSIIFFISTTGNYLFAQNTLEKCVEEGLENNLVLSQKNGSWGKAMIGLQSAKSLYLPTVAVQTTCSTADGGRNIPLPLGDLLNGVYATLNQLTETPKLTQQDS